MSLTPYQQSIWLKMWARNLGYSGVGFVMVGVLAIFGVRFIEHQILIGLIVGPVLLFLSDRVICRIPDLSAAKREADALPSTSALDDDASGAG